ncbi:hypothetical protein Celaphus_00016096 [Cervus elaphus hippelaphus]|uniref:C2H2-type domain-containing protein n=1 Tax=Cervus elaphus hippelaphus TaxID=46360 RepID=A0A212CEW2_CEREH|nr:hypothetical protein Celaphus_00016096 [Cervus elaphus hippelaphus]
MPRSFLVKKVKLDTFSSADLESSYGRARSDLGVRLQEKGGAGLAQGAARPEGTPELTESERLRPFGCAHCGKAFADRSNLRAHMQTHSAFKHFQCKRCKKSFALKSYLNKHYESACFKGAAVGGPPAPAPTAPPQLSPVQA